MKIEIAIEAEVTNFIKIADQTVCEKTDSTVELDSNVSDNDNAMEAKMNSENNKSKPEESEEDIPRDFFDDFLKEDFMAGLDIVDDDAWDGIDEEKMKTEFQKNGKSKDAPAKNASEMTKTTQQPDPSSKTTAGKTETKKKKQESSSKKAAGKSHPSAPAEKKHKQRKRKHEDKGDDQKKKSKEKVIDADEFDIRRDPEKTKRDIERDKVRCEKDKEKKIITEKLNLVETGLVPPGMEMETDIEEIKKQKEKVEKNKPPQDLREHLKNLRASKSPNRKPRDTKRKSPPRKSASVTRRSSPKRRRTRSPKKAKSPGGVSPARNRSNRNSSPLRRRSPLHLRRSPLRRSNNRSFAGRRSRSLSPLPRFRRSRLSPLHSRYRDRSPSRESEREMWLKRRRSRSPRRRRDEKKSFLQELAEKLNETRPLPMNMMPQMPQPMHFAPIPSPVPAPAPVPPPSVPQFFPPQPQPINAQQYDPYDQNFFIGSQPSIPTNFVGQAKPNAVGFPQAQLPLNPVSVQPVPPTPPQVPLAPASAVKITYPHLQPSNIIKTNPKDDIAKLFQDKKITLSEFLAITAKPEAISSNPARLQEKIKVITRCHEALKFLGSNEKKYSGKLVVHHTNTYKVSNEKHKSPLLRNPPVIFPFTHTPTKLEQKPSYINFINLMLQKIGLTKDGELVADKQVPTNTGVGNSQALPKLSPPPPPLITPIRNDLSTGSRPRALSQNQLSKFVQTDVTKCESCEKRKKIVYRVSAVQCGGDTASFSVSTQVTEDDFYNKIPKTQSLASLTPAQLLGHSRPIGENNLSGTIAKFSRGGEKNRGIDKDSFDIPTYADRLNFRPADNYNLPRYSPPRLNPGLYMPQPREEMPPVSNLPFNTFSTMRTPFTGGGGRGRGAMNNLSRPLDSNHRFTYNDYY